MEEVAMLSLKSLERNNVSGPDGLTAEHLQGGDCVILWLTKIVNRIMELELAKGQAGGSCL